MINKYVIVLNITFFTVEELHSSTMRSEKVIFSWKYGKLFSNPIIAFTFTLNFKNI